MAYFDLSSALGGRELTFLDRTESNYPQLARFSLDFDLRVLEALLEGGTKQYALITPDHQLSERRSLSPGFNSVTELEQWASQQTTDILHDYLFDETATEGEEAVA